MFPHKTTCQYRKPPVAIVMLRRLSIGSLVQLAKTNVVQARWGTNWLTPSRRLLPDSAPHRRIVA